MIDIDKINERLEQLVGKIVMGKFHHIDGKDIVIDLDGFMGCLPRREQVNSESYSNGESILFYVLSVENDDSLSKVILSRSHPNLVRRLFETYVAEISGGMVEIRGIAREAGFRTKIAVWSNDKKINPVKSCIGKSGETIKKIVSVLNNEKIDIIRWSENPVIFVKRALNPARLESITLDQENEIIHATADEANLGKAIGRKGQNARLASRLIGWDVQVQLDESK